MKGRARTSGKHHRKIVRKTLKWAIRGFKLFILISLLTYILQLLLFIFNILPPWFGVSLPIELQKNQEENFEEVTETPTIEPTLIPTTVPTLVPTATPTSSPTPTPTPSPTPTPTPSPTPTPTPSPTPTPTPSPTPTPTPSPTPTPTPSPTPTPTPTPTPSPTLSSNTVQAASLPPPSTSEFPHSSSGELNTNSTSLSTPKATIHLATLPPDLTKNYSSVTRLEFTVEDLTFLLESPNNELILGDIKFFITSQTLNVSSDTFLVELDLSLKLLKQLNTYNIFSINFQDIKALNVSSLLNSSEEYRISTMHTVWKPQKDGSYKFAIVMDQSILSIIFFGVCNYDLTN